MREEIAPLDGRVETLENDVKEIYFMVGDLQKDMKSVKRRLGTVEKAVRL
jgi:hypothetical protein